MRSQTVDRLLNSTPKEVEIFVDLYADLVVRVNQILQDNDISKKELAMRMDKNPSEISKWLSGDHNFTLKSVAKLSAELGETLLEVPARRTSSRFISGHIRSIQTFVEYEERRPFSESKIIHCRQYNKLEFLSNVG